MPTAKIIDAMTKKIITIAIAAIAGMWTISGDLMAAPPKTPRGELYGQRATLFEVLGTCPEDIVMLGDSQTHGCEWHDLLGICNVKNRGINGDTVDGIAERLSSVTSGHPKKIFLLCGVNDVSHNLSADSIATSLIELVKRIRRESPRTQLYVESLLPINNSFDRYRLLKDKEEVIRDINRRLAAEVPATGARFININPLFADENGNLREELTNDGLHLMGPAYILWRDAIMPYINE